MLDFVCALHFSSASAISLELKSYWIGMKFRLNTKETCKCAHCYRPCCVTYMFMASKRSVGNTLLLPHFTGIQHHLTFKYLHYIIRFIFTTCSHQLFVNLIDFIAIDGGTCVCVSLKLILKLPLMCNVCNIFESFFSSS